MVVLKRSSTQWRIAGKIEKGCQVLRGRRAQFTFDGVMMTGDIDGMQVTTYSGGVKETTRF